MGKTTGISWCDHTFNPWIGCAKVSKGCEHCYAERQNLWKKWVPAWGPWGLRKRTSPANWRKVQVWNASARRAGVRRKVFCASLADVFEDRDDLYPIRIDLWLLMLANPYLDFLLLTKRPENVIRMVPEDWLETRSARSWPSHVWIGTTAEDQAMADKRIPELQKIPAPVQFISVEPMLERVHLSQYFYDIRYPKPWVICGGESGPGARPMNLDWARNLRDQCKLANVPFFFKQVGGNLRIDGHWGGDLLDGRQHHEFPEEK